MHRIHGDDDIGEVEQSQESVYSGDLVGLRGDRELSQHDPAVVVERAPRMVLPSMAITLRCPRMWVPVHHHECERPAELDARSYGGLMSVKRSRG